MKKLVLLCVVGSLILLQGLAYSATTWYLPEGSTQGTFDLWILVTNPNGTDADVTFTFYTGGGGTVTQSTTISAESRYTLRVNDIAGLEDAAISTKVECTNGLNIYAERAMYWSETEGGTWIGGHTSRAVSGLEGCYIEISQPSSFPITITKPGSYKLISNIECSTLNVNAIEIAADRVTLDLNGFCINGPGYGSGSSGNGIYVNDCNAVKITNGTIRQFRKRGIHLIDSGYPSLSNLTVYYNGEWGVYLNSTFPSTVQDCTIADNGHGESDSTAGGLRIYKSTIAKNNNLYDNKGFGIYAAGDYNTIEKNSVVDTASQGIGITEAGIYIVADYNRVEGNHSVNNNTYDIRLGLGSDDNACIYNSTLLAISDGGAGNQTSVASSGNINL